MTARPAAVAVAAMVGLLAAACSSAPASTGGQSAPAGSARAAAAWHSGGAYSGPIPPNPMPGPKDIVHVQPWTSPDGYKVKAEVSFGVPLHYNIPQRLLNCYTSLTNSQDLPPGQYVIPFEITMHNLLNQQARSIYPDVWAGDKNGNGTIDMTGGMANGNDTYLTWESDGACTSDYYKTLPAQGHAAVFGFIGPATPQELASTWIYAKWDPNSNLEKPVLAWPLTTLLPAQARAWLVSRGAGN